MPTGTYFEGGEEEALRTAIEAAGARCANREPRTSAIVIALDARWLVEDRAALLRCLRSSSIPVAIVLGHQNDPLARKGAVDGLVEVFTEIPDTSLLRCDFGALGALAYGATIGAVGLTTSHRHAVRPGDFAGGRRGARTLRVVQRDSLTFFSADILERVRHVDPYCFCTVCQGQPLHRFIDLGLRSEANRHNVAVWRSVANEVLWERPEHRSAAWLGICKKALEWEREFELKARTDALRVDAQIRRWAELRR